MWGQLNRRQVLAAASVIGSQRIGLTNEVVRPRLPICVFTKPFNSLSFEMLAQRISDLGVQGIEAPIRKGGNIEPERIADELPQLIEALTKRGLEITVMASDINDPLDGETERILRLAAEAGIRRYRMKYFRYDLSRSTGKQLTEWRPMFHDLAAMNRELGITGIYQNHAGRNLLGAAIWDLAIVLEGIPSNEIGVAYDIRHATVEGGLSWPVTFHRIRPHIEVVYVKDFKWNNKRPMNVPLGKGNIDREFFLMLKKSGFAGPISLHEEYLDHKRPELVAEHLAAIKRDTEVLTNWLR